ncbi:ATPase [Pontiella sp.]|uniref:ATPase n=2 Tax=Pontiella sp. TaxID=2837462 RepID=UPI003569488B
MAEELKHLIEQIQKEGVEKASAEAETIVSHAKEKAAKIVAEAQAQAQDMLKKAEIESAAFSQRSAKTLEQAARDLLITIGQGCEKVVTETLGKEVDSALSGETLQKMITDVVLQGEGGATVAVSEADKAALISHCANIAKQSGKSVELVSDNEVLSGFKVVFEGKNVSLDYTGEAIAESLASFLRPELAKTVSGIAREQISK